jgi:hypothetical protein
MPSEAASVARRMRTADTSGCGLERGLHRLALVGGDAAVEGREGAAVLGEALGGEQALQPVLRGAVLGEEDHALVVPLAARAQRRVEPVDELPRPWCRRARGARSAHASMRSSRPTPRSEERAEHRARGRDGLEVALLEEGVVGASPPRRPRPRGAGRRGSASSGAAARPPVADGARVLLQRDAEGLGRGEQPLLEQLEHELRRDASASGRAPRPGGELVYAGGRRARASRRRCTGPRGLELAAGEARAAEIVGRQLALEPADHHAPSCALSGGTPRWKRWSSRSSSSAEKLSV